MLKINLFLIFILLLANFATGQTCNCEKNFEWVKKTFEENDAGFQYAIDIKGKQAYTNHTAAIKQKIKSTKKSEDCTKLLYEWLTFFRSGHIAISRLQSNNNSTSAQPEAAKPVTENWETLKVDVPAFEKYLAEKKQLDYEGIWETPPYKIGIKKIDSSYVGFIVETTAETWKPGEVKIKFNDRAGIFYLRDKSSEAITDIQYLGKTYLQLGRFNLKRLSPSVEIEKSTELFFKSIAANTPFIEELNPTTLVLRIPSFDGSQRKFIDSVIAVSKTKILTTENLIIDLRNNGGGSDFSYKEILPLIYTNPVRTVGAEMYSTKLNNQRMLEFISNPDFGIDEEGKKWAKTAYDTLEKHLGEFINLDSVKITVDKLDTVYPYPKNVGILINNGNGSTTEQFLLAAKQSKKVKLFGTTTFGVLDISNMNFVKSPCNEFELGYSLSKSYRIPDMTIDSKGIQPDYYLDKEIKPYEWIDYVNKILNQK